MTRSGFVPYLNGGTNGQKSRLHLRLPTLAQMSSNALTVNLDHSFAAIDFETATSKHNSAYAVGAVVFKQGSPADTRCSPGLPEVWEQVT